MKRLRSLVLAAAMVLPAAVAPAQSLESLPDDLEKALRQMMDQLRPSLEEAAKLFRNLEMIDDPRHYDVPEVLPNGDIIIRRKPDAPEYRPPQHDPAPGEPPEDAPSEAPIKT